MELCQVTKDGLMSYVPHTAREQRDMLAAIGVDRIEDLFADVPEKVRFPELKLPPPLSEPDLMRETGLLAARNLPADPAHSFLGAGVYHHFRPAVVDYVLSRGEFSTSYTQYQPEVSQGMLQALFEYQSMVCRLTGMEVASASHYNGANALAEAVLLALDAAAGRRRKIVMSPAVHPQYRDVVKTYLSAHAHAAAVIGDGDAAVDAAQSASLIDGGTAALVIQSPDFFGRLQPVAALADAAHRAGALLIVVADPIALGLFRPPGDCGADVVVAEGQPLGIPPSFGGPHLGIFATRMAHVRRMSGHLAGETVDADGRRGYVLTLATREQHIRRARATSNICTNSALCALAGAVYLSTMGKSGLRRVAELCYQKSHYAAAEIGKLKGFAVNPQESLGGPERPFFKEFVVRVPAPVAEVNARLCEQAGIVGGYDLGADYPHLKDHMLLAVTEVNTRASIDRLVMALRKAAT
jgi:glycine dehydrogenase subunit 1